MVILLENKSLKNRALFLNNSKDFFVKRMFNLNLGLVKVKMLFLAIEIRKAFRILEEKF